MSSTTSTRTDDTKRGREHRKKERSSSSSSSSSSPSSKKPKLHDLGLFYRGKTTHPKTLQKLALFPNGGNHYAAQKPNLFLEGVPPLLWEQVIVNFFGLKDLALSREVCTFFETFWSERSKNNTLPLRVPQDVSSFKRAVEDVAYLLSERGNYTKDQPLKIELSQGVHEVESDEYGYKIVEVSCSMKIELSEGVHEMESDKHGYIMLSVESGVCLTLAGASREKTIVHGGFQIGGSCNDAELVKMETMTVTNPKGNGIFVSFDAPEFEGKELLITGCSGHGFVALNQEEDEDSACTLTDCIVTNCGKYGIVSGEYDGNYGRINMHGEKTKITGNAYAGLLIDHWCSAIILHAPLTVESVSYDNHEGNWAGEGACVRIYQKGVVIHGTAYDEDEEQNQELWHQEYWSTCFAPVIIVTAAPVAVPAIAASVATSSDDDDDLFG